MIAALAEDAGFAGMMPADSGGFGPRSDLAGLDAQWRYVKAIARATSSLRLMTHAYVADRDLVFEVARHWTRLPSDTRRRVALLVGNGWMAEEFERFGHSDSNGPRLTEMIGTLREACHRTGVESSRYQSTASAPIFGKGDSLPALRRAALYCDGWIGDSTPSNQVAPIIKTLVEYRRQAAPTTDAFEILVAPSDVSSADLCRHAEGLGATGIVWSPKSGAPDEICSAIECFAETVIARCV